MIEKETVIEIKSKLVYWQLRPAKEKWIQSLFAH